MNRPSRRRELLAAIAVCALVNLGLVIWLVTTFTGSRP